jgi:hypothetical protein
MALILGLVLLAAVVLLLKWYADADVGQIKSSLRWTGLLIGLVIVVGLAATGRLGPALGVLVAMMAWVWRVFGWWQMLRQIGGVFGTASFGRGTGPSRSEVASAFLAMTLDHATGALDGRVLRGRFAGRPLGSLGRDELTALLDEVAGDPDSRGLLEAYLDRRWPEWRGRSAGSRDGAPRPPSAAMDEAEALRVLGLAKGATPAEIKTAYRRLMAQLHPDRGGSDYLAAKVNAAKDVLLGGRDS